MKLFVLRSRRCDGEDRTRNAYTQAFTTRYAERVLGNLIGEKDSCAACGPDCSACRRGYARRLGPQVAGVADLPSVLPYLLEDPARRVPGDVPRHDVILAIHVHEQILLEVLKRCRRWGTRGVVVPIEAPGWLSGAARAEATALAEEQGIEVAFPKPFCDFDPPAGTVLAEFRRRFHIGRPHVELTVRDGTVERAYVHVSAACGATYYVARWLEGKRVDDDLKYEIVAKRLHSYPCTASMDWDDDLGDTIMHVAGEAHYEILAGLTGASRRGPAGMVRSPLGRMVPLPASARENVRNIERAKEIILGQLADRASVSVQSLRRAPRMPPAALHTALLVLKQEGRIRSHNGEIAAV